MNEKFCSCDKFASCGDSLEDLEMEGSNRYLSILTKPDTSSPKLQILGKQLIVTGVIIVTLNC